MVIKIKYDKESLDQYQWLILSLPDEVHSLLGKVFGIYAFEGDFIIHAELKILRVTQEAKVKWQSEFHHDIITEIQIEKDKIKAMEWNSPSYSISPKTGKVIEENSGPSQPAKNSVNHALSARAILDLEKKQGGQVAANLIKESKNFFFSLERRHGVRFMQFNGKAVLRLVFLKKLEAVPATFIITPSLDLKGREVKVKEAKMHAPGVKEAEATVFYISPEKFEEYDKVIEQIMRLYRVSDWMAKDLIAYRVLPDTWFEKNEVIKFITEKVITNKKFKELNKMFKSALI
jgi:hypothetical protein